MQISIKKLVPSFFIALGIFIMLLGFAFIWHYIPPNNFVGVMPEGDYVEDELWYNYNALGGWALVFCGVTSAMFSLFARKKLTGFKHATAAITALVISIALSALALEVITSIINI